MIFDNKYNDMMFITVGKALTKSTSFLHCLNSYYHFAVVTFTLVAAYRPSNLKIQRNNKKYKEIEAEWLGKFLLFFIHLLLHSFGLIVWDLTGINKIYI